MKSLNNKLNCIIALSGGIDSAIALHIIKKTKKYNIICVFMKNWDPLLNNDFAYSNECNWKNDFEMAKKIAKMYDCKIFLENFEKEYWNKVFTPFINEYKRGMVPNPDILCNNYIKFGIFKNQIMRKYNGNVLVTGHYAKIVNKKSGLYLCLSKDKKKDQTYFLSGLNDSQLKNVIFPLQNKLKSDVYKIAKKNNFPNILKKESSGICFIGERNFKNFLKQYIKTKNGNIVDYNTNNIVGTHKGVFFYSISQRKGMGLNSKGEKYNVYKKDLKNNILYVLSENDKRMFTNVIIFNSIHFINNIDLYNKNNEIKCKIRLKHRGDLYNGVLFINEKKFVLSDKYVKLVSPGQYGAIYKNNICMGNGIYK